MIRLLYISKAIGLVSSDDIQTILRTSQRNNTSLGISGVLVHGGGLFMQVLEGAEEAVLRLYVKILDDSRHGDCCIIHISPIKERMFQRWSMGVIESDPLDFQHIADLRAHRLEAVQAQAFTDTMLAFVSRLSLAR